jgi:hypothetical protein
MGCVACSDRADPSRVAALAAGALDLPDLLLMAALVAWEAVRDSDAGAADLEAVLAPELDAASDPEVRVSGQVPEMAPAREFLAEEQEDRKGNFRVCPVRPRFRASRDFSPDKTNRSAGPVPVEDFPVNPGRTSEVPEGGPGKVSRGNPAFHRDRDLARGADPAISGPECREWASGGLADPGLLWLS